MAGFGTVPFGFAPLGALPMVPPVEPITILVSSRAIDGNTELYIIDSDGNPVGMDDVASRVYWLLADATLPTPIITPDTMAAQAAAYATALDPLTSGTEPTITNLAVSVTSPAPGAVLSTVSYLNALTNTKTQITLP